MSNKDQKKRLEKSNKPKLSNKDRKKKKAEKRAAKQDKEITHRIAP